MPRRLPEPPPIEPKEFQSADEIDRGIEKLLRRVRDLNELDVVSDRRDHTGALETARSNVREAIREIFGANSPEFREHEYLEIWGGPGRIGMGEYEIVEGINRGRSRVIGILNGLIKRLTEKRMELMAHGPQAPSTYFDRLNLHRRIADVARDLFMDGHHWEAVFAGAKALVNFVKERSRRDDLGGADLMRTVFSKKNPILSFNPLKDQTDLDEQEGMMHLFEGAVLAIRNPGGHAFPEGTEQRAIELIQLLSLLAYRVEEAKRL